jgi:hypothetical protein
MPIRYCSKHGKLHLMHRFGRTEGGWVAFPIEKINEIRDLYAFFHAANIDTHEYRVIETCCDQCEAMKSLNVDRE